MKFNIWGVGGLIKICREIPSLVNLEQKHQELRVKTSVSSPLIVAGDVIIATKVLVIAICDATMNKESTA